ncbi:MAG: Spy/CpxP family protein refolding chaperone [Gammaproteobacteria bacterium]|nr:Spy/CpxP family protein refolding chaperone [Gammaproteobacteria bacterium]
MKRSNKSIALILAGTLLLGGTGAALAYGGGHHGKGGCDRDGSPMKVLDKLESLSDAQREQIKSIYREQRETMRERMQSGRSDREALHQAMQEGVSGDELRALADKQGDRMADMIVARAELRDRIHAVLTEEQRAELKQLEQKRGNKGRRYFKEN